MKKLFLALALVSSQVFAGPFGIDKGMTLEEVQDQGMFAPIAGLPHRYAATSIKNGYKDFQRYTVTLSPSTGVCQITASTDILESDAYGARAKQDFLILVDNLARKYGEPNSRFDFLRSGSIWSDQRDWMTSLLKKERILESAWTSKRMPKKMPDSIESITVKAVALSRTEVFLSVAYNFDNIVECANAIQSEKNANL